MSAAPIATDEQALSKWHEIGPLIDRMVERIDDPSEFRVGDRSSLGSDDEASDPYQASQVVRMCINAAVDHLHAAKTLVLGSAVLHIAAPSSLARGALETLSVAMWVLHPPRRNDRVLHSLQWHSQNVRDSQRASETVGLTPPRTQEDRLASVARVAERRGLPRSVALGGFKSTTAVRYADQQATSMRVLFPWQLCSGFAHGRPWALLSTAEQDVRPTLRSDVVTVRLVSNYSRALYPNLCAMRLLEDVLRLHQLRAG